MRADGFGRGRTCVRLHPNQERCIIALKGKKSNKHKALKRLRTLRGIYDKPQSLRKAFGLKRRKLSGSQKLFRLFSAC